MKKIVILLVLVIWNFSLKSQITWFINKDSVITYYYHDGDEFEGDKLNTDKWYHSYGWGRSIYLQREQQYYTEGKNSYVKDGHLTLFAQKEKVVEKVIDWLPETDSIKGHRGIMALNKREFKYTAGMIQHKKHFKYGYYEIKFKLTDTAGYWPAFWLYGGTPNEEIDWMELKTERKNSNRVGRGISDPKLNKKRKGIVMRNWGGHVYFKGDLTKEWNVVAGEWTPEYLKYYLNGECVAYSKIPMNLEKSLVANIAVPSNNGPFNPGPDTNLVGRNNFEIDYIRVWTRNPDSAHVFNELQQFSYKDTIAKTKLKSKTRFLYDTREVHKNEGIVASFLPCGEGEYVLQVLGPEIPKKSTYSIIIDGKTTVLKKILQYGDVKIDLKNYVESQVTLVIDAGYKQIVYNIPRK